MEGPLYVCRPSSPDIHMSEMRPPTYLYCQSWLDLRIRKGKQDRLKLRHSVLGTVVVQREMRRCDSSGLHCPLKLPNKTPQRCSRPEFTPTVSRAPCNPLDEPWHRTVRLGLNRLKGYPPVIVWLSASKSVGSVSPRSPLEGNFHHWQ